MRDINSTVFCDVSDFDRRFASPYRPAHDVCVPYRRRSRLHHQDQASTLDQSSRREPSEPEVRAEEDARVPERVDRDRDQELARVDIEYTPEIVALETPV